MAAPPSPTSQRTTGAWPFWAAMYKGVAPFINAGGEDSEWGLLYDPQGNVDFGARFAAALCESGLAVPDGRKVIVVAPKGPDGKGVKCVEVQLGEAEEEPVED